MTMATVYHPPYVILTTPFTTPSDIDPPASLHYNLVRNARFYALSVIIPCGLIANCIAIAVFVRSPLFRTVPGLYFTCLAIADNIALIGELMLWLNTRTSTGPKLFNFMNTDDSFCKAVYLIRYSGRAWSSWIIVSITIERFLCVTFPLKAHRWSSRAKTKAVVAIMLLLAVTLAIYPTWPTNYIGVGVYKNESLCMINNGEKYDIWNWLFVTLGELFVPSAVVSLFTGVIIFQLVKAYSRRVRMMSTRRSTTSSQIHSYGTPRHSNASHSNAASSRNDLQPTLTLVVVAISFIIIRLPYSVIFYINSHKAKNGDKWISFYIYAAYSFALALSVVNYSINFFLYCLSGTQYRKQFWLFLRCAKTQRTPFQGHTNMSILSKHRGSQMTTSSGSNGVTTMLTRTMSLNGREGKQTQFWARSIWASVRHHRHGADSEHPSKL